MGDTGYGKSTISRENGMSEPKDGGPAFPGGHEGWDESGNEVRYGMSLRDYFAAIAATESNISY